MTWQWAGMPGVMVVVEAREQWSTVCGGGSRPFISPSTFIFLSMATSTADHGAWPARQQPGKDSHPVRAVNLVFIGRGKANAVYRISQAVPCSYRQD